VGYRLHLTFLQIEACESPISSNLPLNSFNFTPTSLNSSSNRSSIASRLSSSPTMDLHVPSDQSLSSSEEGTPQGMLNSRIVVYDTFDDPAEGPATSAFLLPLSFAFFSLSFAAVAHLSNSIEGMRTYRSVTYSSGNKGGTGMPS
jgi:hypothetical protein